MKRILLEYLYLAEIRCPSFFAVFPSGYNLQMGSDGELDLLKLRIIEGKDATTSSFSDL